MGWGPEFAFRDCPWCGLRDAQMNQMMVNGEAKASKKTPRLWSVVACPRWAGAILLETNGATVNPPKVLQALPKDNRATAEVKYLPPDVAKYYNDAQRVLDAGVPDAVAVELRKTLEAAAAHFNVKEKVLVKSIEKLIDMGLVNRMTPTATGACFNRLMVPWISRSQSDD